MNHIVEISFDFDDEKVKDTAERAVENEMEKIVKDIVLDRIAPMSSGWYGKPARDWSILNQKVENTIQEFLEEHREDIIETAAKKLVQSVRATKVWKEKYKEIIDE